MKFIHAADIHLDSPLRGLARYEGSPVDEIRGATRRAFKNLVDVCLNEGAELLVLAGDIYDGAWKDYNTGLFFVGQLRRLTNEGVRVALVKGNHDAASQITKQLTLPDGAIEFSTRSPQTHVLEDLGVALHGQSYGQRDVTEDLASRYPEPISGLFNLGILHTALDGREGHDAYAPCSAARLIERGYEYWALGHVHRREIVSEDPWIVFPGNLQGRHARETGPKGATLVTIEDGTVSSLQELELDVVRWCRCEVDVTDSTSGHDVVDRVRQALEVDAESAGDRLLAARVCLQGRSAADRDLRSHKARWDNEIRAAALDASAPVWIEKIAFDTRVDVDVTALIEGTGPVAELLRAIRRASDDDETLGEIIGSLKGLADKLPLEYRELDEALDLTSRDTAVALLAEIERTLLPHLLSLEGTE